MCELQANLPCALPWCLDKATGGRYQTFHEHFAWQGFEGPERTSEGTEDPLGRQVQVCLFRHDVARPGWSLHEFVHCRTHDWRRGHARDLQRGGARLWEILQAGDWKSPAFLSYLDAHQLEAGCVAEAHELGEIENSDEDEG